MRVFAFINSFQQSHHAKGNPGWRRPFDRKKETIAIIHAKAKNCRCLKSASLVPRSGYFDTILWVVCRQWSVVSRHWSMVRSRSSCRFVKFVSPLAIPVPRDLRFCRRCSDFRIIVRQHGGPNLLGDFSQKQTKATKVWSPLCFLRCLLWDQEPPSVPRSITLENRIVFGDD